MSYDPIRPLLPKAKRLNFKPGQTHWYCHTEEGLPRRKLPAGYYLVHNHIRPQRPLGSHGFRAWVTDSAEGLAACSCDFGRNRNAGVNRHYCVEAAGATRH
jgi:hypothetical protein